MIGNHFGDVDVDMAGKMNDAEYYGLCEDLAAFDCGFGIAELHAKPWLTS